MKETRQTHPEFEQWEQLFDNLNVWDNPDEVDEATTRRTIEVELIEKTFSDDTDIKYGRDVTERDVSPKDFQSTDRVEIERIEDEEMGKTYRVSAKLTDLNPNPKERYTLHFEGYVSEENGLETNHPVIIRKG